MLVAGVTSGASLIQSAKTRALMNEINSYKQGVMSYYAARGKLTGDPTNSGQIGYSSPNDGYDFSNDSDYGKYLDVKEAPLFDLNKEGILEYDVDNLKYSFSGGGKMSNVIRNTFYNFAYINNNYDDNYQKGLNSNVLDLTSKYDGFIPAKIALAIDEEMDDGIHNSGSIRGMCSTNFKIEDNYGDIYGDVTDYKEAADSKNGRCDEMNFKLDV